MFDGAAFGKEIVSSVRTYLERTLDPVLKRIETLEGKNADLALPEYLRESVALSIRMMAETPTTVEVKETV